MPDSIVSLDVQARQITAPRAAELYDILASMDEPTFLTPRDFQKLCGERLKKLLELSHISQVEAAHVIGTSKAQVNHSNGISLSSLLVSMSYAPGV